MLLAWMLTGSVGTFIASFYKPDWPSKTLLGQKVWFQVRKHPKLHHTLLSYCLFWGSLGVVLVAFGIGL